MPWNKPKAGIFNSSGDEGTVPEQDSQVQRTEIDLMAIGEPDIRKTYVKPGANSDPTPGMPGA